MNELGEKIINWNILIINTIFNVQCLIGAVIAIKYILYKKWNVIVIFIAMLKYFKWCWNSVLFSFCWKAQAMDSSDAEKTLVPRLLLLALLSLVISLTKRTKVTVLLSICTSKAFYTVLVQLEWGTIE